MTRLAYLIVVILALAFVLPANAQTNLLDDGFLDLASSGTTVSNSDWELIVNTPDDTFPSAQFQTNWANASNTGIGGAQPPGTGTGVWFRSFEGDQGNSGEPLAQATLVQTIVAPYSGDYTLEFIAGREANFLAREFFVTFESNGTGGSSTVDLLTAAIPDGNLGGAATGNPGGTPFSLTLLGVTAGDMLTVIGQMTDGEDTTIPGGQSAFLDSFFIPNAIPEPSSAVLGVLGVGWVLQRRRSI